MTAPVVDASAARALLTEALAAELGASWVSVELEAEGGAVTPARAEAFLRLSHDTWRDEEDPPFAFGAIVDALEALPAGERAAWLERMCEAAACAYEAWS